MIDPRTTDIVGSRVRIVKRADSRQMQGHGVVRVVDYNQGAFALLIEAVGRIGDGSWWFRVEDGELFEVSMSDETLAVVVERESPMDLDPDTTDGCAATITGSQRSELSKVMNALRAHSDSAVRQEALRLAGLVTALYEQLVVE